MKNYLQTSEERRKNRVRLSVRNQGKPRLSIFRSGRYIYAQLIDDQKHCTLASASSIEKESGLVGSKSNCTAAEWVGQKIAERGKKEGVTEVVFDRGSYRFHGRIKVLADAARSGGLSF